MNLAEIISTLPSSLNLRFIPIRANKMPIHKNWQTDKETKYDFTNAEAVGLVCGDLSGGLEVIDFDLKYDLTGTLFSEYKKSVHEIDPTLLSKMVVQRTMSGGYHFIYRCRSYEGNKKLANRPVTEDEKKQTYERNFAKFLQESGGDINVRDEKYIEADAKARMQMNNDKVRVLIETRGDRGQIACVPTPNYQFVYGDFTKIQEISPEERQVLFDVAYTFNKVVKEEPLHVTKQYKPKKTTKGLAPFEDYDDRADVVQLLISHGWSYVHRRGSKVMLRRPGDTSAPTSGNYDEQLKWFSVFSTSTQFEPQTPYRPYAVFAMLECNGDFSETARRLRDMGYGDKEDETKSTKVEVRSVIDTTDDDISFLSTREEESEYIEKWINGTFERGLTTGMPRLDKHFLFKRGNLVMTNGLDNVGKSSVIWFLAMLSARFHGWKWLIFSSENNPSSVRKKLMEFYWDKPINKQNERERTESKNFVYSNFDIIKNAEDMYNYMDILNMAKKSMKRKKYDSIMIDPYNSLKVDAPRGKGGSYDYHYEAASVMKLFGQNNDVSIYLNLHVGTTGARNVDKEGYAKAPQKADTEQGVMFPNKADEFITIHRHVQHPDEYMFTELHVRKVKEVETGGGPTPMFSPVILRATRGITGFTSLSGKDPHEIGQNPIKDLLDKNKPKQASIFDTNSLELPIFDNTPPDMEDSPF